MCVFGAREPRRAGTHRLGFSAATKPRKALKQASIDRADERESQ